MKRQSLRMCLSFRAKIKKYRAKAVCTPAQKEPRSNCLCITSYKYSSCHNNKSKMFFHLEWAWANVWPVALS